MDETLVFTQYINWGALGANSVVLIWAIRVLWADYKIVQNARIDDLKPVARMLEQAATAQEALARENRERARAQELMATTLNSHTTALSELKESINSIETFGRESIARSDAYRDHMKEQVVRIEKSIQGLFTRGN